MLDKQWLVRPDGIFGENDSIDSVEAYLLKLRGIGSDGSDVFFTPSSMPPLPESAALDNAAELILDAVDSGKKITVFGDYDCDGICATAILARFFSEYFDCETDYYIPDRFTEGYGMSVPAIEKLCELGTEMIVTVDNGISALAAAKRAEELGIDLIITDHHTPGAELPPCAALVDPHIDECGFDFKDECGAGVAFTLIRKIADIIGLETSDVLPYLVPAAVATVGDSVPLIGHNRSSVRAGLNMLRRIISSMILL